MAVARGLTEQFEPPVAAEAAPVAAPDAPTAPESPTVIDDLQARNALLEGDNALLLAANARLQAELAEARHRRQSNGCRSRLRPSIARWLVKR